MRSNQEHASTSILREHGYHFSHYVSRLRAEIGAGIRRDFLQVKYHWSG